MTWRSGRYRDVLRHGAVGELFGGIRAPPWPNLRRELDRIHLSTFSGTAGTFRQRTEITKAQHGILRRLWRQRGSRAAGGAAP